MRHLRVKAAGAALFAFVLAGPTAPSDAAKNFMPIPGPSVAETPPPSQHGRVADRLRKAVKPLTEKQARVQLQRVPEVIAFVAEIARLSHGTVPVGIGSEDDGTPRGGWWHFRVEEAHEDHTALWHWFEVNAITGEVRVIADPSDDEYVTLNKWRERVALGSAY